MRRRIALRRDARRHAVEVGAGGCGRGGGVGDLGGGRRGDADLIEPDAELLGDDLRDLEVEALPHLGAAMVQVDGAVLIDVHEGAGLVHVREGETDAELHRRQRKAALHDARRRVEGRDVAPPGTVIRRPLEGLDEAEQRVGLLHLHAIRREVAARPVEVGIAHVEGIAARGPGDPVHHGLDRQHALRAAEAAKRGVGHGVGLQPARRHPDVRHPIGVVGVEHRAVDDTAGQVRRAAATGEVVDDEACG